MDDTRVPVEDNTYTVSYVVNNVLLQIRDLKLFTSVTILASLYQDKTIITNQTIILIGEEYDAWGYSDEYIIDICLNKLGLTKKPELKVTLQ